MTEITSQRTGSVSHTFIKRIILFYTPRKFTGESTAFDMGYEQCKRDLRILVLNMVPQARELDADETPVQAPAEPDQRKRSARWSFGKRS